MKIGILTFHYSCNYGGVLQAYATQNTLKGLGHDAEVIDLVPSTYKRSWKCYLQGLKSWNFFRKQLCRFLYSKRLKNAFDVFRSEHMYFSNRINETQLASLNSKYDAIIVGSDQVWNWSQHTQKAFFINWEPLFQGKRISYAPCCAMNKVVDGCEDTLQKALNAFDAISVRNRETQSFVRDLTGIVPEVVCDPTILHSFEEFVTPIDKRPYILAYIIGKEIEGGNSAAIKAIKSKYPDCEVIGIQTVYDNPQLMPWADNVRYTADPVEWVDLIANATCVYTDSFHGVIFSMKFKRDFVCYYAEAHRASRFIDMADRYGIGDNIISRADTITGMNTSLFVTPDQAISAFEKQRADSLAFLEQALKDQE